MWFTSRTAMPRFDHPHSFAYCSIGECYEKLGDFSKAIMFYEKSLEIDDSQSDAWIGIGVVRDLVNEPFEAKKFISLGIPYRNQKTQVGQTVLETSCARVY